MTLFVRVLKCECGKVHCCAGIGPATRCTCDRPLYPLVWSHGHSGRAV